MSAPLSPDITKKLMDLLPAKGVILDAGCGDLSFLRELSDENRTLLAADIRTPDEIPVNIVFRCARAEELPFEDACADAVLMQCVFSLCDPQKTARQVKRVLKKEGIFILSDLYSRTPESAVCSGENLGRIEPKEKLESYFKGIFEPVRFEDVSDALVNMLAQAIMDGETCVSCADLTVLRERKAGYGIWVWKPIKEGES